MEEVHTGYGRTQVLWDVSLTVPPGSVVALLGANGAGKTTTLRVISGLLRPWRGFVQADGMRLDGLAPEAIVRRGIVQVPEGRQVFPGLTVEENLRLGAYGRRDRAQVRRDRETVLQLFPALAQRLHQRAGSLSGGEQQMLAIGRALMASPRYLLLDELSLGLAPVMVQQIFAHVTNLPTRGLGVLVVEQNVPLALRVASYAYILQNGRVVRQGPAAEIAADERLRLYYLGASANHHPPCRGAGQGDVHLGR